MVLELQLKGGKSPLILLEELQRPQTNTIQDPLQRTRKRLLTGRGDLLEKPLDYLCVWRTLEIARNRPEVRQFCNAASLC
jgi:hypothetical protein